MATQSYHHVQKDFSGGEITGKLFMRDDLAMYAKSVNVMLNFIPTLQGTAVRAPGTRFFSEVVEGDCRIIPFLSQANESTLVVITPATAAGANDGSMDILSGFYDEISNTAAATVSGGADVRAPGPVWVNISKNGLFGNGLKEWWAFPEEYPVQGGTLGTSLLDNSVLLISRAGYKASEDPTATLVKALTIPEDATEFQFNANYRYIDNFSGTDEKYEGELLIGTVPFGRDIYDHQFNEKTLTLGSSGLDQEAVYRDMMADGTTPIAFTAGQVIHFTFTILAIEDSGPSTPAFLFYGLLFYTIQQREVNSEVVGAIPYTADEIGDIQYIQSPYTDGSGGKQLVMVHPNHHPKWLQFQTGVYSFIDIPFQDAAVTQQAWASTGYPAACTSFNGRLILAGSKTYPYLGSPAPAGSETVWGTVSGNWRSFSDSVTEIVPDSAIEFTAIYRSPIQWVAGQKHLLVGAREMEYVASADGIFQPADIGVSMHSTHGSVNVQPVGLGETVLYPAEGGTRVRSMNFQNDDDGYVSPDLTFMNPTLCSSGIRRMARIRNPHQIVVVLMNDGLLAMLSFDPHVGVLGWSRIKLSGSILDICVLTNDAGEDVLFCTVERRVEGVLKVYIETFRDWTEGEYGDYVQSNVKQIFAPTNVITGLDHLEGKRVQVIGDGDYLGVFVVEAGTVTLVNQIGDPLNISSAVIGLPMSARLRTLPLVTPDPGSKKRFVDITVRGVFSTLALINGERTLDRSPATLMGKSEPLQWFADYQVANLGADEYQGIQIKETVPFRTEVIGIFGQVRTDSL